MSGTILAYGFKRTSQELAGLGAQDKVYIDHDRKRRDRAKLIEDLRGGEIVRVLYLRDLGGSPVADRIWRQRIEAKGATVEEVRPERRQQRRGAPSTKFAPTPEQRRAIRAAWLDESRSLADRCQAVVDIYGRKVSRHLLYYHFGKPGSPKPDTDN